LNALLSPASGEGPGAQRWQHFVELMFDSASAEVVDMFVSSFTQKDERAVLSGLARFGMDMLDTIPDKEN